MNIKTLMAEFQDAEYLGEVEGDRRTYYIYKGNRHYVLFSFNKARSGYFNAVENEAVDYVRNAFAGEKKLTTSAVLKRSRRRRYVQDGLGALNILYVLVALRQATMKSNKPPLKGLVFNIRQLKK